MITDVSLILGVAGAVASASTVRLAGVAGLLAGAFSMAAGGLVSVRAQDELVERETAGVELEELTEHPDAERRELAGMYRARGVNAEETQDTVARIVSEYRSIAFDTHARLELRMDPQSTRSAWQAEHSVAFYRLLLGRSCPSFRGCSSVDTEAVVISICIGAVAAAALGAVVGAFTGRGVVRTAIRRLAGWRRTSRPGFPSALAASLALPAADPRRGSPVSPTVSAFAVPCSPIAGWTS